MANAFFVPPLYPDSVSIKTSSYTIPAGNWAIVHVTQYGSSDFTIDGAVAVQQTEIYNSANNSTSGSYTVDSGRSAVVSIYVDANSGTIEYQNSGNNVFVTLVSVSGDSQVHNVRLSGGDRIAWNSLAGNRDVTIAGHYVDLPPQTTFKVPTGTQLNGQRYVVELYSEFQ